MTIHLTGIGGVGMAGLAVLLKRRGHEVTGCDLKPTARTRWLESLGIPVAIGHDAKHVEGQELVIVTPAVAKDNPEYIAAVGRGRPPGGPDSSPSVGSAPRADRRPRCLSRGEVLAKLVSDAPDSIAVCGSHGKTTTATFIAKLLIALGESVEWAIGGETGDFPVAGNVDAGPCPRQKEDSAHLFGRGRGPASTVLVVEADESDGTLAEYAAKTLVVTNCEYDHADHFKTRADYVACYDAARAKAGDVVDAESVRVTCRREICSRQEEDAFVLIGRGKDSASTGERGKDSASTGLAPHNRQNALMAVEVARRRGHSLAAIAAVLPEVVSQLPDRRFQRVWPMGEGVRPETRDASGGVRRETSGVGSQVSGPQPPNSTSQFLVYTDYAHHPTEMACAVKMARATAKGRVIVLFQPHRYSRTKALISEFPAAFAGADEVVLCPTYAAFEQPVEGGDIADLYAACVDAVARRVDNGPTIPCPARRAVSSAGTPRFYLARSCAEAWEHARNAMKAGDLTLLLGAGDIIDLVPQIQSDMRPSVDAVAHRVEEESDLSLLDAVRPPRLQDAISNRVHEKRRIWIGAGSNTWKSDLKLDVEYVKTEGPAGRSGATLLADPQIGPRIPWMAGIPGTIGGWIKMNAGAFGHSISEVIESVKVDGAWIPAAACGFSYRHSGIDGEIQDVRFVDAKSVRVPVDAESFPRQDKDSTVHIGRGEATASPERGEATASAFLARRKKFPPGTKGSVFKNPPGDHAGRLLEAAGAKALRVGGAHVWSEHANVIVAGPDATPSDFLALARLMAARVRFRFGVSLEPEVAGLSV